MPDCTVIIAEDHGITSGGIKFLLDGVPGVNVIQVVQDGEAAIKAVDQQEPDVLILDIALPKRNGLMVLQTIRELKTRTLVLSGQASGLDFQRALESGAAGLCSKADPPDVLLEALAAIRAGEVFISEHVRALIQPLEPGLATSLTRREREILSLLAEGQSTEEMHQKLGISHRTVKKHRENLMRKLGVNTAVEATRKAMQLGLTHVT